LTGHFRRHRDGRAPTRSRRMPAHCTWPLMRQNQARCSRAGSFRCSRQPARQNRAGPQVTHGRMEGRGF
jgi:hypothetical protein